MRKAFGALLITALSMGSAHAATATNPKADNPCSKINLKKTFNGFTYTCIKSGKKLIWNKGVPARKSTSNQSSTPPAPKSPSPTVTTKPISTYEATKLKAYRNIRAGADSGNLDNVSLVYHVSEYFPKDLRELYTSQVEYASKLYGSFFKKKEVINIYMYTEKDESYLATERMFLQELPSHKQWFESWKNGIGRQHNLGLAAWFMEYPNPGIWQGHAGLLVYSGATTKSLQRYSIQVMPHEYWHVVQDYYFRSKWEDYWQNHPNKSLNGEDFYALLFPTTFREGSANTISFAMASKTESDYLKLYSEFIREKKTQTEVKLFSTLTSTAAVESALKKIENRRLFSEAHESSYSLGGLLYEWVIAEYGFDAYRRLIENQLIGNSFEDNVRASLGISIEEMYKKAAPHILAAFSH